MNIVMIGTGYVGLVSGVCFAEFGYSVTCVDKNAAIIDRLKSGKVTIYEAGLDELLERNVREGRLSFTTDLEEAVGKAEIVFVAVGTPSGPDGDVDLRYVERAADEIAAAMRPGLTIVIKSTVVVGTAATIRERIAAARPGVAFSIVSNPEFLREGSAVEDFMKPDRIVVGVADAEGRAMMERVYRPLFLREAPLIFTSLENAEIIKYAANSYLAMKVSYINQIADLCEKTGGDVQDVARAIGMDERIGSKFLHAGPGFGGSCFPKDTRAFAATGRRFDAPQALIETVVTYNDARKRRMADRILELLGDPGGKTVAVLGIAFKPNTDDIRESPSLDIVPALTKAGVAVRAHDPEAMNAARGVLDGVCWCRSAYEAADGADATVILTEWSVYRTMDLTRLRAAMRGRLLIDLRNIFLADDLAATDFDYHSVGRPLVRRPNVAAD